MLLLMPRIMQIPGGPHLLFLVPEMFRAVDRQYSVFVPEIDREHQLIYTLCRNLQRALRGSAPAAQVRSLVNELAVHSSEHFWHEEQQMRAAGYLHYAWHK